MRFSLYVLLSVLALSASISHIRSKFSQVYPAAVYVTEDRVSQAVLMNFVLMLLLSLGRGMLQMFCGKLRDLELEALVDSCKSVIADTLIIFVFYSPTVDGKEVGTGVLMCAVCLMVYVKIFHIISSIRVSHMFEIGLPTSATICRLFALLVLLTLVDAAIVHSFFRRYHVQSTLYTWALFEGATLLVSALTTLAKLQLNLLDIRLAHGLPNKPILLFYADLIHDALHMAAYCLFMLLFVLNHPGRLPLYAISDFANVARQLLGKVRSFTRYRQLTKNIHQAFATPSVGECREAGDCIICRDALVIVAAAEELPQGHEDDGAAAEAAVAAADAAPAAGTKKLGCSHIYHTDCLKNWLLMQQTCPTCRADIAPQAQPTPGEAVPDVAGEAASPAAPAGAPAGPPADEDRRESQRTEISVQSSASASASALPQAGYAPTPSQQKLISQALAMRDYYRQQVVFWRDQLHGEQLPGEAPGNLEFD